MSENAKIEKFLCDILSNFQTLWANSPTQIEPSKDMDFILKLNLTLG